MPASQGCQPELAGWERDLEGPDDRDSAAAVGVDMKADSLVRRRADEAATDAPRYDCMAASWL
jgi:hypothetical protein